MNYLVKTIGSVLLLYAALFITREYEKFLGRRLGVCLGFCELISHVRRRVEGYLTPADRLLDGFECGALEDVGYMSKARNSGLRNAYFEVEGALPLDCATREALSEFFTDFGKDYKEETVKAADRALSALRGCADRMSCENEKSLRLWRAVAVAAALGVIILLI